MGIVSVLLSAYGVSEAEQAALYQAAAGVAAGVSAVLAVVSKWREGRRGA